MTEKDGGDFWEKETHYRGNSGCGGVTVNLLSPLWNARQDVVGGERNAQS